MQRVRGIETMTKVVSNLLSDISKARDLIQRGDVREIYNKRVIFERISRGVKTQLKFYVKSPAHELDFNHEDLSALSTEVFEYIKNFQQKFLYSKMYKDITAVTPITKEIFTEFSTRIGYEFTVHAVLTAFYKEMAYLGLTIFLWSQTDDKKPFDEQLTDLIRSFI
jgi:hypothetical protein